MGSSMYPLVVWSKHRPILPQLHPCLCPEFWGFSGDFSPRQLPSPWAAA